MCHFRRLTTISVLPQWRASVRNLGFTGGFALLGAVFESLSEAWRTCKSAVNASIVRGPCYVEWPPFSMPRRRPLHCSAAGRGILCNPGTSGTSVRTAKRGSCPKRVHVWHGSQCPAQTRHQLGGHWHNTTAFRNNSSERLTDTGRSRSFLLCLALLLWETDSRTGCPKYRTVQRPA